MANKNPSHKFPEGNNVGNKHGSPAKTRIKKSKLRGLAEKLRQREDEALAIVDRSLKEDKVGNETVSTAKWVLQSIVSIEKAALAEEMTNFNARLKGRSPTEEGGEPEQSPEEIEREMPQRLSLVYTAPEDDED